MPAPNIIKNLVQRFEEHHDSYRSGRYNETQLRREFLDPFFEAMGWNVFNKRVKWDVESTDRQINNLVYELYGLTEDEIKVVEGG